MGMLILLKQGREQTFVTHKSFDITELGDFHMAEPQKGNRQSGWPPFNTGDELSDMLTGAIQAWQIIIRCASCWRFLLFAGIVNCPT